MLFYPKMRKELLCQKKKNETTDTDSATKNMIMVIENDYTSTKGFEHLSIRPTPYQSYEHNQTWMHLWTRSLSPTENIF